MATITAQRALKINQYVGMAFSSGMCFFPTKMMEGYKANTFTGEAAVAFQFFLGIMGTQILLVAFLAASAARDAVPDSVKSVACLCFGLYWAFFALDGGTLHIRGVLPDAFPPEGIYANAALFSVLSVLSFLGWAQSGSYLPTGSIVPKGRPAKALLAGMANLGFFAVGCAFFAPSFVEMFLPGLLGSLPGAVSTRRYTVGPLEGPVPPIMLIVDRAGKTMLFAIASALAMASVGTEDTTFRLLRAWVLQGFFYMGTFARDGVVAEAMPAMASPMRVASFVQVYAALFYMTNTMMGMPYKLEKAK